MILNNRCIVCESSVELNTIINVIIDGKKYDVAICDKHAEDTTPKKTKDLVQKKLAEFDQLVKRMKDFGIVIPQDDLKSNKIAVAQRVEEEAPLLEGVEPDLPKEPAVKEKMVVAKKAVNSKVNVQRKIQFQKNPIRSAVSGPVNSVGGTVNSERGAGSVEIDKRGSLDVASVVTESIGKLKERGYVKKDQEVSVPIPIKVESQMVPGRKGVPVRLPKVIRDNNGGVTTIAIINTGGNEAIQERFKELADESRRTEGNTAYSFGEKGYDVINCSLCEGTGKARATGDVCPKCKGVGMLNRGRRG